MLIQAVLSLSASGHTTATTSTNVLATDNADVMCTTNLPSSPMQRSSQVFVSALRETNEGLIVAEWAVADKRRPTKGAAAPLRGVEASSLWRHRYPPHRAFKLFQRCALVQCLLESEQEPRSAPDHLLWSTSVCLKSAIDVVEVVTKLSDNVDVM